MKKFIAGFFAFLFLQEVSAQNSLVGKITDKNTGIAIPGATIYINDLKKGTTSDTSGNYTLENLPSGIFLVECRYLGYQSEIKKIEIKGSVNHNFSLEESHTELKDVLITGMSSASEKSIHPVPSLSINSEKLKSIPSTNIIDALTTLPGINQISTGGGISKPVVRGLGFNRVLVLNNNIRQEGQQWGDEHGLELDEFSVGKVEIIKGPGSLAYGSDAMGGVINFLSPDPIEKNKQSLKATSSFQTNNKMHGYSLLYEGNKNDVYWNLLGSRKQAGNYSNKYDGKVFNSGFEEWNGSGSVGVSKKWGFSQLNFSSYNQEVGIITGKRDSLGKFTDEIQVNDSTVEDQAVESSVLNGYVIRVPKQRVNHQRISVNGKIFKNISVFQYTIGLQQNRRREFELHDHGGVFVEEASLHQVLNTITYDFAYRRNIKDWDFSSGINGYKQSGLNEGEEYIIPEYQLNDIGLYLLTQRNFEKLNFSGGIRYNYRHLETEALYINQFGYSTSENDTNARQKFYHINRDFSSLAYSAGAGYRITEKMIVKANFSGGFRAPNLAELGSNGGHHGTFRYEIGNADLKAETSMQADFSFIAETKHLSLELNAFYNKIDNFIYARKLLANNGSDSIIIEFDEASKVFIYEQNDAYLYGGEFSIDIHPHPFDWLHFQNSFSFVNAEMINGTDSTRYLPFIPAPRLQSEIRAEMHENKGCFSKGFFGINLTHQFEQTRFFSAYDTETLTPAYTLLNISIGTEIISKKKKKTIAEIIFMAQNITDVAYQNHLSRLKYTDENQLTDRRGVYNMGRNFVMKVNIPIAC